VYKVKLDFHDNAVSGEVQFSNMTDLALYLERVPSMIGFEINKAVTIDIQLVTAVHPYPSLFDS
jgi:hypothetical protein